MAYYTLEQLQRGRFSALLNLLRLEESPFQPEQIWPDYERRHLYGYEGGLLPVTLAGTIHRVKGKELKLPHNAYPDTLFVEVEALAISAEPSRLQARDGRAAYRAATLVVPCLGGPLTVSPKYGGRGDRLKVRFTGVKPILDEDGNVVRGLNGRGDTLYYLDEYTVVDVVQRRERPAAPIAPVAPQANVVPV
jgi:hypothetical protein